jgi:aminoglycoside phosphotransferase (APT) family kinase protein
MLAAGTPDGRPGALPGELARLLDADAWWEQLIHQEREEGTVARRTLRAQLPIVTGLADELTAVGIAASVQHDDLHGGNVLVGPHGDRFFDWGDAVVAHPFGTLTVTFNSIAHKLELPAEDPAFARLEAVYLEAWDGVAPRADLRRAAAIARVLGCIGRALAWERSLSGLEDGEMDGFGDGVAGWLVEFAGRLSSLATTR